jgi:phosphoglucosamine mutase
MEELIQFVKESNADIGLAFDGDADRCLAVDELGNMIDGDQIMAICGLHMKEEGKLPNDTIVATVMSNLGFFIMGKEKGVNIEQTKVGDRYVLERMREKGYKLGGEQSGHVIFLEHNTTGDGLMTAVQLLSVMKKTGKKLSELAAVMEVLPQVLVNARIKNEKKELYLTDSKITKAMADLEAKFAGEGRVLIRPSGTEPLIRVMIEGKDKALMQEEAQKLAELLEKILN